MIATLQNLYKRDLAKLKTEIASYKNESAIWIIDKNISNSAGNLALHLVGNLNTYIGDIIGHSGYIRNRELEFSAKDVPQHKLIELIEATAEIVDQSLSLLKTADLSEEYPVLVFKEKTSMEYMLIHLCAHLSYHLGQINYHRRLLDN